MCVMLLITFLELKEGGTILREQSDVFHRGLPAGASSRPPVGTLLKDLRSEVVTPHPIPSQDGLHHHRAPACSSPPQPREGESSLPVLPGSSLLAGRSEAGIEVSPREPAAHTAHTQNRGPICDK